MRSKTKLIALILGLIGVFCFADAPILCSEDVSLPFGAKVAKSGIDKILNSTDIVQFIRSLEKEGIRVIAVNKKRGKRTRITIPKKYWDTDGQMTKFFELAQNDFFQLNDDHNKGIWKGIWGLYIRKGQESWNKEHAIILICKDASLDVIRHEYLHHLIAKNTSNNVYSVFHKKKVFKDEFSKYLKNVLGPKADKLDNILSEAERKKKDIDENTTKELVQTTISLTYFESAILKSWLREEIEIDLYLLSKRNAFKHDAIENWGNIGTIAAHCLSIRNYILSTESTTKTTVSDAHSLLKDNNNLSNNEKKIIESLLDETEKNLLVLRNTFDAVRKKLRPLIAKYRPLKGDVNTDGKCNSKDRTFLSNAISNSKMKMSYLQETNCDINNDGKITELDLKILKRLLSSK